MYKVLVRYDNKSRIEYTCDKVLTDYKRAVPYENFMVLEKGSERAFINLNKVTSINITEINDEQ